jgi:hypothetical protein
MQTGTATTEAAMRCKNEPEDLPAWIIDQLPSPPAPPQQPWLEAPAVQWNDPTDSPAPPRGEGGTVIIIDL